jgi:hypothetical protein
MGANEVAIVKRLKVLGINDVGVIYNFSHARDARHDDTVNFPAVWRQIKPYVAAVDITGTYTDPIRVYPSQGDRELEMMRTIHEPKLNPVYRAMLAHCNVTADPCRVEDPDRKGSVENAIKHTQTTALKGRKFESIEAQNAWLAHWEERWAATRIHGRKKRQVMAMFLEEKAHLLPLPLEAFRPFKYVVRTVDNAGLVQVESSYYSALVILRLKGARDFRRNGATEKWSKRTLPKWC